MHITEFIWKSTKEANVNELEDYLVQLKNERGLEMERCLVKSLFLSTKIW